MTIDEIRARWAKVQHPAIVDHYGDCRPGLHDGCVCTGWFDPIDDVAFLLAEVERLTKATHEECRNNILAWSDRAVAAEVERDQLAAALDAVIFEGLHRGRELIPSEALRLALLDARRVLNDVKPASKGTT